MGCGNELPQYLRRENRSAVAAAFPGTLQFYPRPTEIEDAAPLLQDDKPSGAEGAELPVTLAERAILSAKQIVGSPSLRINE